MTEDNVPVSKNVRKFFFCILKVTEERSQTVRSGSLSQRYRSGDPNPHQHVTDPQHYL
jgi:hypothetical protein